MTKSSSEKKQMALHSKILLSLILGVTAGVTVNLTVGSGNIQGFVANVTEPIGRMWLGALIMVVIPLIISTLSLGVVGLGDLKTLGRIGLITILCFLMLTTISTILGLTVMNVFQPGAGLDPAVKDKLMELYKGEAKGAMGLGSGGFGVELFVKMIPRNPFKPWRTAKCWP